MTYVNHLPPLNRQFVAHFGEMGSRWGINRTVGQMYALIFLSPRPLNADELRRFMDTEIARWARVVQASGARID